MILISYSIKGTNRLSGDYKLVSYLICKVPVVSIGLCDSR